jgi:hypothetical protein
LNIFCGINKLKKIKTNFISLNNYKNDENFSKIKTFNFFKAQSSFIWIILKSTVEICLYSINKRKKNLFII